MAGARTLGGWHQRLDHCHLHPLQRRRTGRHRSGRRGRARAARAAAGARLGAGGRSGQLHGHISPDVNFTDPTRIKTTTTKGTSLVLSTLQLPDTYYWRVRGLIATGFTTEWSEPRSYRVIGLEKPGLVAPVDDINQNIEEVVLDWTPVPGATSYDVQVSTDVNFLTSHPSTVSAAPVVAAGTLDNDQYYWRVRPLDAAGNKRDWSAVSIWKFRRNWPRQPALEYPGNDATVGDPFYFQWTPVTLASEYRVQVATNQLRASFVVLHDDAHHVRRASARPAHPAAAGTYYWRVLAVDGDSDVVSDVITLRYAGSSTCPSRPCSSPPQPGPRSSYPR